MAKRSRDSILEAMAVFKGLAEGVSVHQIMAFLYTCENEGLSVQELATVAGLTQSAASRNLRALGRPDSDWSLPPALGLVEVFRSSRDSRHHLVQLTAEGRALRERLDGIINKATPIVGEPGALVEPNRLGSK